MNADFIHRSKEQQAKMTTFVQSNSSMPVALLQGYNMVEGKAMNTALTGDAELVGGTSFVKCDICSSTSTLMRSLNIGESLSVSLPPLISLSEKLQFLLSLSATSTTTFIVIYARHIKGQEVVTNVRGLMPGVKRPFHRDQVRKFVEYYGDSYLSSKTTGGEYYAVYSYYSDSVTQQMELRAAINAEGILQGIGVDASLQLKINSLNKKTRRRISLQQFMSGIANPGFPTSDGITQFACNFPKMELTSPALIDWQTTGYEHVPVIGTFFVPVADNRNLLTSFDMSTSLSKLQALKGTIDEIKRVYRIYGEYNEDDKLDRVKDQVDADEILVTSYKASYLEDPTRPLKVPLTLPSFDNGIPSLQYVIDVITLMEEANSNEGEQFDDVPDAEVYFQQRTRISSLQLRGGPHVVNCLFVSYASEEIPIQTIEHGSHDHDSNSQLSPKLEILPNCFVESLTGLYDKRITKLNIQLSNGDRINGGNADDMAQAISFSWSKPSNSFLIGFRGRAGKCIYDLQLICASFSPVIWFRSP